MNDWDVVSWGLREVYRIFSTKVTMVSARNVPYCHSKRGVAADLRKYAPSHCDSFFARRL